MRTGVIAKKMGMTRLFQADGRHVPVTVLQLEDVQVVGRREKNRDGYTAVALGAGTAKAKNVAKPQRGAFGKAEVEPKAKVVEFRVAEDALLDIGATITADHFVAGQLVDIQGVTQGKGFQGGMKRWGFGGLRATHGVSVSAPFAWARPVSARIRARSSRTRRWPATWAPRTAPSRTSRSSAPTRLRGLIFVKGSVPGSKGGWLKVIDAVKLPRNENVPYPAGLVEKGKKADDVEHAPAGLVDDAAVHEIPALPGDDEVAAIAAQQEAGAIEAEAEEAAAEADAADAAQSADNEKAAAAEASDKPANADDSKEG